MAMAWVWTGMVVLSLVFGLATGSLDAVADAALEGAGSAVELSISMAGILCLWSGVMEIMNACGISGGLARAFRPLLRRLLPAILRPGTGLCPSPRWRTSWPWPGIPKAPIGWPPTSISRGSTPPRWGEPWCPGISRASWTAPASRFRAWRGRRFSAGSAVRRRI